MNVEELQRSINEETFPYELNPEWEVVTNVKVIEAARLVADPNIIDIVFDGPPGHIAGRFVEVENQDRQSVRVGEWIERDDGYWVLRLAALLED